MSTGLGGTRFKFALVAFLAGAGLTGAALAQDPDANLLTGTGTNRASTHAFPAHIAKPVIPVGKPKAAEPAPEIVKLPGSRQAAGARVELIHLPTFSAAGSIG
jgi:hypothetical protein